MGLRCVIFRLSLLLAGMLAAAGASAHAGTQNAHDQNPSGIFGFEQVKHIAADRAATAYVEPPKIPDFLQHLDYDHWRDISFKSDRSLWRGEHLLFEVQFFHPGFLYRMPVKINVVDGRQVKEIQFSPDLFNYGMNDFGPKVPQKLGFAGFRIHFPLNRANYYDEVMVFLGASYFRAVGKGQKYGVSARGLAIDVAEQSGEEHPFFREFWLVKPLPGQRVMTIYALLDSSSVSGAYRFTVDPGEQTLVHVNCTLYCRQAVKKLGLAPMNSMFFYGENVNVRPDNYRPEVHDSDGLLIGPVRGEWIWRPLTNPKTLQLSVFPVNQLRGFGLLQRDLDFEHYQDLEAYYQQRPSLWITPQNNWGPGHVELLEIPTNSDSNNNIIASWVPRQMPQPGHPLSLAYRMSWYFPHKDRHVKGWVLATRTSATEDPNKRRFLIDFRGGQLDRLNNALALEPVVTVTNGARIVDQQLQRNSYADSWRLVFSVVSPKKELLDKMIAGSNNSFTISAFLRQEGHAVTETWSYRFEY